MSQLTYIVYVSEVYIMNYIDVSKEPFGTDRRRLHQPNEFAA